MDDMVWSNGLKNRKHSAMMEENKLTNIYTSYEHLLTSKERRTYHLIDNPWCDTHQTRGLFPTFRLSEKSLLHSTRQAIEEKIRQQASDTDHVRCGDYLLLLLVYVDAQQ